MIRKVKGFMKSKNELVFSCSKDNKYLNLLTGISYDSILNFYNLIHQNNEIQI